jgi:hypothetical protein
MALLPLRASTLSRQPDPPSFDKARALLLEGVAEAEGDSLLSVVRAYREDAEFKRRIDIGARAISSSPASSDAIH